MTTETQAQAETLTPNDIARRIAEALGRTGEPKPRSEPGSFTFQVEELIGAVPRHLQHLHNLMEEVSAEALELKRALDQKLREARVVHQVFFAALSPHVTLPEDSCYCMVLPDWNVAVGQAHFHNGSSHYGDDDGLGGLADALDSFLGGRR